MRRKSFLPRGGTGRVWLYLLERKDGTVKVGKSERPRNRYFQHVDQSLRFANPVTRFHLFGHHARGDSFGAEQLAISALARRGVRVGRSEEFRNLDFHEAIAIIRAVLKD